ncbi:NAD(P)-binding domain-containing protein [Mesorhizobium sp. LHD-90]|uniref:NAD(P)-binding domain-containing protein n=1 Tax=Mesorhizobium sp. LHD-90 TaxID=3071414 RepID=UPI0027E184D5|nr:NAD(P)-binding domain-containing protein [Mesorhizobium sp. LHD-90]MDQ6433172.1 NAD(P)-binding domain-containing protein [Mesorhizobium sp. LHD-90]
MVIGAGHAGLAMSRCLAERSVDHVVLERGEVANSWRTERWDSLRLLTPNWQSRLPGYDYDGGEPDGYRTMPEVIDFLDRYARVISAPVQTGTTVKSVSTTDQGFAVATDKGAWNCRTVVLASGACNVPRVPSLAAMVPPSVATVTAKDYRNSGQLDEGAVMVVGASATGTQLADEIHRSGRPVTLVVGEHVRAPRVYRGKDIEWWMDVTGLNDQRYDRVDDIERARRLPSFQLAGSPERRTLDLNALTEIGVKLVGRIAAISDGKAQFSGSLHNSCAMADLKMNRLLNTFDQWSSENGFDGQVEAPHRLDPTQVEAKPPLHIDLSSGRIKTILWATGYRPDYSWLHVAVLDRKGNIRHDGGIVAHAGLYLMGMQFLRRRKSALIDGAGDDARDLSDHLVAFLRRK